MSDLILPSRRDLLLGASVLAGSALLPAWGGRLLAQPRFASHPFTLGVASGEPEPNGMVLWTRLAPAPFEERGGMGEDAVPVGWEVSEDGGFTRIVQSGTVWAMPHAAHSVHVEVGGLRPDRQYFYRFHAGHETSSIGRTRTTPLPGDDVASLRYAFTACQHYETGYYGAYRHLVEDDPALILFLGDYIYERPGLPDRPRRHLDEPAADLASYRRRFAQYKGDANLQAAHAAAPWMVMWDDHEVANNYNAEVSQSGRDAAAFLVRRAAAYQAYYEHMPLRRRSLPVGPDMQLYRSLAWGRLVRFQLLDGRQYRDDMACREPAPAGKTVADCAARQDPARSMLGMPQERWLMRDLAGSDARWNVVAQQFMMAEARRPDPVTGEISFALDGWDGYAAARDRLLAFLRDAKIANPVAIGGDSHAFIASHLAIGDGPTIMPAFVGGSLSSTSGPDFSKMVEASPQIRFSENRQRGYSIVDVTPQATVLKMRAAADATNPLTATTTLRRFEMEAGRPGFA
ncbi:MAG: alkaline phosphatase D family protein [Pseudomonadota bacterium]|nr:alkaline phosphatase D family protein [Pseudomonadota bacterium]